MINKRWKTFIVYNQKLTPGRANIKSIPSPSPRSSKRKEAVTPPFWRYTCHKSTSRIHEASRGELDEWSEPAEQWDICHDYAVLIPGFVGYTNSVLY